MRHAQENLPYIRKSIRDLDRFAPERASAIVLAAGPSLHRHPTAQQIQDHRYQDRGILVATDGALGYCLRNDLIPDFVVSVDPHPTRIVRWFGDPQLESRPADDYFRRQDLDPDLGRDEKKKNRELIERVNRYGPKIRAVLSTSVSPSVTQRALEAGMPIFWWNPIYDDFGASGSVTRRVFEMTQVPCMVAGGNCGTAAWIFSGEVLKKDPVGVVGMDLGYAPGTPLEATQYYTELKECLGDRFREAYLQIWNPQLKQTWATDPTYWWYRESFLTLARQASWKTSNCTQGGILFGEGILWESLEDFLGKMSNGKDPVH